MRYTLRFLKFNERGQERKLASTSFQAPDLLSAMRGAIASLERTDPATAAQVIGLRILQAEAPAPSLALVPGGEAEEVE